MKMCSVRFPSIVLASTILLISNGVTHAQENNDNRLLPAGLGFSNHLEYSWATDTKNEILENWLNLDYNYSAFTAGIRFDVFQPNDPNPAINRGRVQYADIAFKYIRADVGNVREGASLTVGNYYGLFGRGLILKSYEDRTIRVDNNLLGLKLIGRYGGFQLTALTGQGENLQAKRTETIHAADLEYKGFKHVRAGLTFASNQPDALGIARTRLLAARLEPSLGNLDLYTEYGIKQNNDTKESTFHGSESIVGRAFYGSLNFFYNRFSVAGEYRLYDNYAFTSGDQTVVYNNPPAVRRDYSYILLNRHPVPLDANNERGYQVELNYGLGEETSLLASYSETKTLDMSSYYQRIVGSTNPTRLQLREAFGKAYHPWDQSLTTTFAFGYSEEGVTATKSVTPILEAVYTLDEINSLRLIGEHQHVTVRTTGERYFDNVITLEYQRSPGLALSIVGEMQTHEPTAGSIEREFWFLGQATFEISTHTDASVVIGSRQAGNFCIGGVCRYEPAFKGIELKLYTRL